MKRRTRAILAPLAAAAAACATLFTFAPSAMAASLVQITNFGTNPTNLGMYEYVPANVSAHPAVLVAIHQCTSSGPAFYSSTQFASLADQYGFIVIYPSATRSGSCFDVSSPGALTHNGNSDPEGIVSMVQYVEAHDNADPSRIFVTGASSGGMMTDVLLGDYPNVFAAGAAFMGVPFGCFATTDGSMWNSACADGDVSMTAAAWGNLVRNAYPGYTGARPRVQLWHGTADPTLNYNNFGQEILQWTNVLGVSSSPSLTNTPQSGWTHTQYDNSSGTVEVDAYSIAGAGHVLPETGMAVVAIDFFGLNNTAPPTSPPPTTAPPTTAPPTTAPPTTSPPTTAPPTTAPPTGGSGSCSVADVVDAWNTGLTQQITITNTGSSAINGWKLAFTLGSGQVITSQWNATITPTSGAVSAVNLSYNVTIPAGGSTGFGFQETQTGNANAPASFTLNGATCTSTVTG